MKYLILFLLLFSSCASLRKIDIETVLGAGGDLAKQKVKKHFFKQADFNKDTVNLKGVFLMRDIRKVIKSRKIRVFLTEKCEISVRKRDFHGFVNWNRFSKDSVNLHIFRANFPYIPLYPDEEGNSNNNR